MLKSIGIWFFALLLSAAADLAPSVQRAKELIEHVATDETVIGLLRGSFAESPESLKTAGHYVSSNWNAIEPSIHELATNENEWLVLVRIGVELPAEDYLKVVRPAVEFFLKNKISEEILLIALTPYNTNKETLFMYNSDHPRVGPIFEFS